VISATKILHLHQKTSFEVEYWQVLHFRSNSWKSWFVCTGRVEWFKSSNKNF